MPMRCRCCSSAGRVITRLPLPCLTDTAQQGQARTGQDRPGRASPLSVWPVAGVPGSRRASVPTLWEPPSPPTGELQGLLDITGLRGGLPKTNTSLFTSAWKSHKKFVSSCVHSAASGGACCDLHAHAACQAPGGGRPSREGPARRRPLSPPLPLPSHHRHQPCWDPNSQQSRGRFTGEAGREKMLECNEHGQEHTRKLLTGR